MLSSWAYFHILCFGLLVGLIWMHERCYIGDQHAKARATSGIPDGALTRLREKDPCWATRCIRRTESPTVIHCKMAQRNQSHLYPSARKFKSQVGGDCLADRFSHRPCGLAGLYSNTV